jgi:hypothetical protein
MDHIVEIRHMGHDFDAARAALKAWLQNHGIEPVEFECSVGGPGITFRVHFAAEKDATAFAGMFHGSLNNGCDRREARWTTSSLRSATP